MENPLILVIDDSPTIRKMVECHLSQAGYRVVTAATPSRAGAGPQLRPDLILLDHQLPGHDRRRGLPPAAGGRARPRGSPSSSARPCGTGPSPSYTEFTNVVDQIPKPFTPELLKSGVANALQTGALVVQAQRTGCAMPEAVGEVHDATLEGTTASFPLRSVLDFLNNAGSPAGSRSRPATTASGSPSRRRPGAGGLFADGRARSAGRFAPRRLPTSRRCWP